MKKVLCLFLVVACIFACVGCGSSDSFAEDKDFMVRDLTQWADAATEIGNTYVRLGNITGAKLMFSYLELFLAVEDIDDFYAIFGSSDMFTDQYIAEFFL